MREVFNEAVGKIRNPNSLSPTALKNKINSNVWNIIKTGSGESAGKVQAALETLGFENVQGQGYLMRAGRAGMLQTLPQ